MDCKQPGGETANELLRPQ